MKVLCLMALAVLTMDGDAKDGGMGSPCRTDAQCGPSFVCVNRLPPNAPPDRTCAPGCRLAHPNCPENAVCTQDATGPVFKTWRCKDKKTGKWTDGGS